jgi:hypothetical protein
MNLIYSLEETGLELKASAGLFSIRYLTSPVRAQDVLFMTIRIQEYLDLYGEAML